MQQARRLAGCVLLNDGRVLLAGGAHGLPDKHRYLNTVEIYDPTTERWSPAPNMAFARDNAKAVQLLDGRVLVIGGGDPNGEIQEAEIYSPATGQ